MAAISAISSAQSYLALPPPGGARGTAAGAKGTAEADYVELAPVAAVPSVKRQPENTDAAQSEQGKSGGGATTTSLQSQTQTQAQSQGPDNRPRVAVGSQPGQSNTGFVVQSLSQETIGNGLHIEPWQAALASYRSAAALPGSAASNQSGVTV